MFKEQETLAELRRLINEQSRTLQGRLSDVDLIDTSAYGKQKPLDTATVSDLQTRNPNQPPEKRVRDSRTTWLAYNRRVDIVLVPTNAESERFYPNQAADSEILWQKAKPSPGAVEGSN